MYNDTDLVPKALTWMDVASTVRRRAEQHDVSQLTAYLRVATPPPQLHGAVSEAELAKEMAVE